MLVQQQIKKAIQKKSGEVIEPRTEWHSVVLWRNLANTIEQYVKVGMHLYIEGELRSRIWRDKEGVDHYTTEVMANTMQMLGSKKDNMQSVPKVVETHHNEEQHQQLQDDTNIDDDLPF